MPLVVHLRGRRQLHGAGFAQLEELVLGRRHADLWWIIPPARHQFVQRLWFDDGTRQRVRAHETALLKHTNCQIGIRLLEFHGAGQTSWSGADDDDVVFHDVAFDVAPVRHCVLMSGGMGAHTLVESGGNFCRNRDWIAQQHLCVALALGVGSK